jgi:hypothetical protein
MARMPEPYPAPACPAIAGHGCGFPRTSPATVATHHRKPAVRACRTRHSGYPPLVERNARLPACHAACRAAASKLTARCSMHRSHRGRSQTSFSLSKREDPAMPHWQHVGYCQRRQRSIHADATEIRPSGKPRRPSSRTPPPFPACPFSGLLLRSRPGLRRSRARPG